MDTTTTEYQLHITSSSADNLHIASPAMVAQEVPTPATTVKYPQQCETPYPQQCKTTTYPTQLLIIQCPIPHIKPQPQIQPQHVVQYVTQPTVTNHKEYKRTTYSAVLPMPPRNKNKGYDMALVTTKGSLIPFARGPGDTPKSIEVASMCI